MRCLHSNEGQTIHLDTGNGVEIVMPVEIAIKLRDDMIWVLNTLDLPVSHDILAGINDDYAIAIEHLRYVFYHRLSTGQTIADIMAESEYQRVIEITNIINDNIKRPSAKTENGPCADAIASLCRAAEDRVLTDATVGMMARDIVKYYRQQQSKPDQESENADG